MVADNFDAVGFWVAIKPEARSVLRDSNLERSYRPFLGRMIAVKETDLAVHELLKRSQALLAIYTNAFVFNFLPASMVHRLRLDVEYDWRYKVAHYK